MADSLTIKTDPGTDPSKVPVGATGSTNNDGLTTATASSETQNQPPAEIKKLAGKFDSPEALEQAYLELQKKLGGNATTEGTKAPQVPTIDTSAQAEKAVKDAGLDMDALQDEFTSNGALSAESLSKLQQHGLSKETVEKYVKGAIATAAQHFDAVAQVAGGAEQLAQVLEWAAANASADDIQAYNDAVATKNLGVVKMAVGKLTADYTRANGSAPKLVTGETVPQGSQNVQPFASAYEVTQAMNDPRYSKDPAYRDKVYARLAVTQMFGA